MARATTHKADYQLLFLFIGLLVFGLIMLASASTPVGYARFDNDGYFFLKRQLLLGVLPGTILFLILAKIDYHKYRNLGMAAFVATVVGLLTVFIPGLGSDLNTGTNSWVVLGGHSVQPAEFAKLGLIIFMSAFLAKKGHELLDLKQGFLPLLAFGMIPIGLVVLQPDIGTVSIMFAIMFGLLFLAGAKIKHLSALAGLGLVALIILIVIAPYRTARLTIFLHPELDPQGIGYHINQAFLAIGSGGFFGLGLGHSRQKFQYLPEVHADSIYAVIAEEMGFLIAFGLVLLILAIGYKGLKVAKHAPDQFGRLLAGGIIIWFLVQSFANIAAIIGLMPLTGVPLPFISHGGTALMIAMAAVGILINISKQTDVV